MSNTSAEDIEKLHKRAACVAEALYLSLVTVKLRKP